MCLAASGRRGRPWAAQQRLCCISARACGCWRPTSASAAPSFFFFFFFLPRSRISSLSSTAVGAPTIVRVIVAARDQRRRQGGGEGRQISPPAPTCELIHLLFHLLRHDGSNELQRRSSGLPRRNSRAELAGGVLWNTGSTGECSTETWQRTQRQMEPGEGGASRQLIGRSTEKAGADAARGTRHAFTTPLADLPSPAQSVPPRADQALNPPAAGWMAAAAAALSSARPA